MGMVRKADAIGTVPPSIEPSRDRLAYELVYCYPPAMSLPQTSVEEVIGNLDGWSQHLANAAVYIHLPFCTGRCTYCHYARRTKRGGDHAAASEYLEVLKQEVRLLKGVLPLDGSPTRIIHFGGGTPTFLSADQIQETMDFVSEEVPLHSQAEITWESSPETILENGGEKIDALLQTGVNRLNIGIQSFDDRMLKVMARRYRSADAIRAITLSRDKGFKNVNIDLIYGLPDQTTTIWEHTLAKVGELRPESVTVYQLRVKPGTPISRIPHTRFPDEQTCFDMSQTTLDWLGTLGYQAWQPNQFVLGKEYVHRYLKSKWEGQSEVIGIGVSAYSFVNNCMYVNHRILPEYYESIRGGRLPIWVGKKLSWEQQVAKAIVLGIKLLPNGVDKEVFAERFGIRPEDHYADAIRTLTEAGLVESGPRYLRLTEKGILLADEVCTEFYAEEDKEALRKMGATRYGSYFDPLK